MVLPGGSAALVLVFSTIRASVAAADPTADSGILVEGETPGEPSPVERQFEAALREAAGKRFDPAACTSDVCPRVHVRVSERERDYDIATEVIWSDGRTRSSTSRCSICTPREAGARAAADAFVLVDAPPPAPTSTPDAAPTNDTKAPRRTMQIAGWTLVGVGVVAIATGIGLVAVDENPVKNDCSGVHVDRFGNCEFRWNTMGAGVGVLVPGVIAAAAGATLVAIDTRRRRDPSRTQARLGIGLGRVSLTLRF